MRSRSTNIPAPSDSTLRFAFAALAGFAVLLVAAVILNATGGGI
ncbi:hypothetical protein [Devosia sp. MC1541]|nr:hypothetical protein [Devosia sp. MC1541]